MSDATAGKWDFQDDAERREAIVEEAEIAKEAALAVAEENRRAAVDAAEAAAPQWHWVAFWLGLFAYLMVGAIYGR